MVVMVVSCFEAEEEVETLDRKLGVETSCRDRKQEEKECFEGQWMN